MEGKMGKTSGYVVALVVGLLMGGVGAYFVGRAYGDRAVRVEAVKAGHARHVIVDDYGGTKFEWLPDPAKKQP